jgi:hypothetical protein
MLATETTDFSAHDETQLLDPRGITFTQALAYGRPGNARACFEQELVRGSLQKRDADSLVRNHGALARQMIEATKVAGVHTPKQLLV